MKKQWILTAVYAIIAALYTAVSLILVTERTGLFWAGLAFFLISAAFAGAVSVLVSIKKSAAFPMELAFVVFSIIYLLTVFSVNIVFCYIFKAPIRIFVSVQLMLMAIYAIVMLLFSLARNKIIRGKERAARNI